MAEPTWRDVLELVTGLRDENRAYYSEVREAMDGFRDRLEAFENDQHTALMLHTSRIDTKLEHTNRNANEAVTKLDNHLTTHRKLSEEEIKGRWAARVQTIVTIGLIIVALMK